MHSKICCCCKGTETSGTYHPNVQDKAPVTQQPLPQAIEPKTFEQECLEEHNRLRSLHGCPSLRMSRSLSAYAAEWAKTLAERNMLLEYRTEEKFGENLFVARDYNVEARIVVKTWYDEIWLYNFSQPGYVPGVEHFTQVIWKDTKEMGVGVRRRGGNVWIVVNYQPKGNIIGCFENNIPMTIE